MTREEIHQRQKARVLASVRCYSPRPAKGHASKQDKYGLVVKGARAVPCSR